MEKRTKNKKRPGSFSSKEIYLLSGLLVCKHCNGLYYGNKRTKRNKYNTYYYYKYVCHNKNKLNNCNAPELNQFEIESLVIEKVLLNSNNIDKILDKINEKYTELYNTANTDIVDIEIYFKFNADIDKSNTSIEKSQRQNSLAYLAP